MAIQLYVTEIVLNYIGAGVKEGRCSEQRPVNSYCCESEKQLLWRRKVLRLYERMGV